MWVVSFKPDRFNPWESDTGAHWLSWMCSRADLDAVAERKISLPLPGIEPRSCIPQPSSERTDVCRLECVPVSPHIELKVPVAPSGDRLPGWSSNYVLSSSTSHSQFIGMMLAWNMYECMNAHGLHVLLPLSVVFHFRNYTERRWYFACGLRAVQNFVFASFCPYTSALHATKMELYRISVKRTAAHSTENWYRTLSEVQTSLIFVR
jgi:hypothetical protein